MRLLTIIIFITVLGGCTRKPAPKDDTGLPESNRFRKSVVTADITSPVQLKIAGDGRIYLIETSGHLKLIDPVTGHLRLAGTINTYDGMEFGLLGFALDPGFLKNGWIYFQYGLPSRREDSCMFQVSRFTMQGDTLQLNSEKKLLTIPYVHSCCHTAGGMSIDSKGNLYFSTGDNTDAFQTVYSPSDERPGHEIANALRSASNSMDLRGKILRIHPEPDGTFTIPEGNLFPGGRNGRPEIYIMGCRNAYRIFVDTKTDVLYWGEVGPDADKDSTRGPKGYDEFNIAREAGYYGWPMFIGNNKPYKKIDFASASIGETFNPDSPVNYSRLNTGLKKLPAPHPASIWYPYVESPNFSGFGTGGRTAIGGPVYHYSDTLKSAVKFPSYFDNCWIIGDWMRNWLKAVHLGNQTAVGKIDSLMGTTHFAKPIDMAFGKDGALYVIEYGSNWGDNNDSKLVRIEYISGNRPPVARIQVDSMYGGIPMTVHFSAGESDDADHDSLSYQWQLAGKIISGEKNFSFVFKQPGNYEVSLTVSDAHGEKNGTVQKIYAGNARPTVSIRLPNQTFYWTSTSYQLSVNDREDGQLSHGISVSSLATALIQLPHNSLIDNNGLIRQKGELLIASSDCKSCHSNNLESVGPAFEKVAATYTATAGHIQQLATKVLKGGKGNWGERAMAPHPQLVMEQAEEMVRYILSLAKSPDSSALSMNGIIQPAAAITNGREPVYLLRSSYTDRGGPGAAPVTASATYLLRSPKMYPEDFDELYESSITENTWYGRHEGYVRIRDIDLTGIKKVVVHAGGKGRIELHLDQPVGPTVGVINLPDLAGERELETIVAETSGMHSLYLVRKSEQSRFSESLLQWILFKN